MKRVDERKKQETCEGCGEQIADSEKECPTCGAFPDKAYHQRAESKRSGSSKTARNSDVFQSNQKLTETSHPLINIISFDNF